MANQQAHQRVSTSLMRDIFFQKLKPGEKLPSERDLADSMSVDRTSLRVALKQLEAMELLDIRPGDGIYVKNFLEHAGIDFLRTLFSRNEALENELAADMFVIDEVWEWWIIMFPEMLKLASQRASARDLKALSDLMDRELNNLDNRDALIELWLDEQDMIAHAVNNMVLMLLFNSSRPLRRNMLRIYHDGVNREDMEHFIITKKSLLMDFLMNADKTMLLDVERYREILIAQRQVARSKLIQSNRSSDQTNIKEP
jgi:GntR family transcriptional repressor for pyruvate dehydrogenase complex